LHDCGQCYTNGPRNNLNCLCGDLRSEFVRSSILLYFNLCLVLKIETIYFMSDLSLCFRELRLYVDRVLP